MDASQMKHEQWSSPWIFILAAAGSAVGLGNIWRFPYIVGKNGGGAFVLVYLICIFVVGLSLFICETLIGRFGQKNPVASAEALAKSTGRSKYWKWLGAWGVLGGFLILSYYAVIAGWTLDYVFHEALAGFAGQSNQAISAYYGKLLADPKLLLLLDTLVTIVTVGIVAVGVQKGLESAVKFMIPALILLLLVIVGYAMTTGYFGKAVSFLLKPNFHQLTESSILSALGHAFFTLSIAMGSIMVYGSYMPKQFPIIKASAVVTLVDTGIAILAGFAIFPIVFSSGLAPGDGPGLIFKTLPIAFSHMPYGSFFATLFFIMLLFAGLSSAIALLEPLVAWLRERFGIHRAKAAVWSGLAVWITSLLTVFSFNRWSDVTFFGKTFFDLIDYVTSNIMLPLGGLFLAIFVGWLVKKDILIKELNINDGLLFRSWRFSLRYIAPIAILLIFLNYLGLVESEKWIHELTLASHNLWISLLK